MVTIITTLLSGLGKLKKYPWIIPVILFLVVVCLWRHDANQITTLQAQVVQDQKDLGQAHANEKALTDGIDTQNAQVQLWKDAADQETSRADTAQASANQIRNLTDAKVRQALQAIPPAPAAPPDQIMTWVLDGIKSPSPTEKGN